MKKFFILIINFYQKSVSFFERKDVCMFYPSCSEYTKQAIQKYGSFKGIYLGILRILHCHPFQENKIDSLQ